MASKSGSAQYSGCLVEENYGTNQVRGCDFSRHHFCENTLILWPSSCFASLGFYSRVFTLFCALHTHNEISDKSSPAPLLLWVLYLLLSFIAWELQCKVRLYVCSSRMFLTYPPPSTPLLYVRTYVCTYIHTYLHRQVLLHRLIK